MSRGILRSIIDTEERNRKKVTLTIKHHRVLAFVLSIIVAVIILQSQDIRTAIIASADYGYIGALFAGLFFSYGMTTPIALVVFALLGQTLNPVLLGLLGGVGAMVSDWTMFTFLRSTLVSEIKRYNKNKYVAQFKQSNVFALLQQVTPLAAGIIIASPLPDELAVALFGFSTIKTRKFLLMSYVFNAIGLMIVAGVGRLFS